MTNSLFTFYWNVKSFDKHVLENFVTCLWLRKTLYFKTKIRMKWGKFLHCRCLFVLITLICIFPVQYNNYYFKYFATLHLFNFSVNESMRSFFFFNQCSFNILNEKQFKLFIYFILYFFCLVSLLFCNNMENL